MDDYDITLSEIVSKSKIIKTLESDELLKKAVESLVFEDEPEVFFPSPLEELLGTVGIVRYGKKYLSHFFPGISKLCDAGSSRDLSYFGKMVIDIEIPFIGCERLTRRRLDGLVEAGSLSASPVTKQVQYLYGAREKIDGESAVVFGITLEDDSKVFFIWMRKY